MAEGINVRFAGTLQQFIQSRVGELGLYNTASEYIRDLVRRDYERDEERKWSQLHDELASGLEADEADFSPLDAASLLEKARITRSANEG
jgi:antitoxin ParD1/3/4